MRTVATIAALALVACTNSNVNPDASQRPDGGFIIDDAGIIKTPCGATEASPSEACTSVSWQFSMESADGQNFNPLNCPSGFDTIAVIGQKATSAGEPLAACGLGDGNDTTCFVDLVDCNAFSAQQVLPRGFATQQVTLTNATGAQVYGSSPATFEVLDGISFQGLFANLIDNGGYIRASWTLSRGGSPATCTSVVNDAMVTIATSISFAQFPCDDGNNAFNFTTPHPSGTYSVMAQVVGPIGAFGNPTTTSVTLATHDDLATTGTMTLVVP